jgi:hypothetical protein
MILFFRNIPAETHPSELKGYVMPALEGGLFSRSGRILRAEIIIMRDKTTKKLEYHGLVHVDSDQAGKRAIKKLNEKPFKNMTIFVREYFNRNRKNDPRSTQKTVPKDIINKRIQDRRIVSNLEIMNDYPRAFSADYTITRKYR